MKFNTKYKIEKCPGTHFRKPSLTDQSQAFSCDINNIVNGFVAPNVQTREPIFGQTFSPNTFNTAMNIVAHAKSEFEKLPSQVRRAFDDDINKFVNFMDNPTEENCKKGVKLGIYNEKVLEQFKNAKTVDSSAIQPTASSDNQVTPD